MLDIGGFIRNGMGYENDLGVGVGVTAFFNCLARSGQSLGTITGVPARRVDQMLHPWPSRKTTGTGQLSLEL